MPKPLFTEGKAADKFVGYVLNIGAIKIKGRNIDAEEGNRRYEEAKEQWRIIHNDFLGYDATYRQKYGSSISKDIYGYFNNPEAHFDGRKSITKSGINFNTWLNDYRYFSYQRLNTPQFKELSADDINFIFDINADFWLDFVLVKNEGHKARNIRLMNEFLKDYFNLIDLLKHDLKITNLSFNEQLSDVTRQAIKKLTQATFSFLDRSKIMLLEFKKDEKFFFNLADLPGEYDPAWRFNRMVKLLNEFVMPLAIASNTYQVDKLDFWNKDNASYEKERIWYPKYLFNQWDSTNGVRVAELKEYKTRDEAVEAWKTYVANNVGIGIYFGDIDKKTE